jgi:hypothetical protein
MAISYVPQPLKLQYRESASQTNSSKMGEDPQVKRKHYKEAGITSFHFTFSLNIRGNQNRPAWRPTSFLTAEKDVGR